MSLTVLSAFPETCQERAAAAMWLLANGDRLTTTEIAQLLKVQRLTAYVMLCRISRVVPIFEDDDGRWTVAKRPTP